MSARRCPGCGGEVHAIAGRCKHCKLALAAMPAPAGPGPAGAQPDTSMAPRATWSRWWPAAIMAAALLAIGVSAGVMIERWRQARSLQDAEVRPRSVTPRPVPDRMPRPSVPPGAR